MQALKVHQVVKKDGEIRLTGLPCQKGQDVEMILLLDDATASRAPVLRASDLKKSNLAGLWNDRGDIDDTPSFARGLREQNQRRRRLS